jgi:DNA-binding SARP family transcriptional activator
VADGGINLVLFGGFTAHRPDGSAIELPTRKAEALLAYLACRAGEAQPRDRLTALLWGDRADAQARHSLSQTLTSIRRALNGAAAILNVDRDTVTLRACAADIDIAGFKRLAASDSSDDLRAAADLYRGPFLDGFKLRDSAFEDWLQQERAQLYESAVTVLIKLARCRVTAGDLEGAAAALNQALVLDPLAEEAHRQLIRLHLTRAPTTRRSAATGNAPGFKARANTVPEPATTELYREALRHLEDPRSRAPNRCARIDGQRFSAFSTGKQCRRIVGPPRRRRVSVRNLARTLSRLISPTASPRHHHGAVMLAAISGHRRNSTAFHKAERNAAQAGRAGRALFPARQHAPGRGQVHIAVQLVD